MQFENVEPQADFPALERRMLEFWDRIGAFERLKAKNAGKPRWSFLDGPITANNPMGVHHAWGRTYKDAYNRYFAMTGHELRYQQGFDCQGLWVEVEVEKELKLHNKCHHRGLVYRGYDSMPWCGRCGVGISEMEMKEGYKLTEHKSVFVKLPLKDRPSENLLVWTTTPWTLPANVGAAVNPELPYLKVKLKGEVYYVAKGAFKLNRMESAGEDEGEPGASATGGKRARREWLDGGP